MLNYKELILDSLYEADLIDDALYEKCQPSYISGLPGNLRSTDANVLQSRLDAIDEKIEEFNEKIEEELEKRNELDKNTDMHEENIKYYNKQISDFVKKEQEFESFNEELQGEALDLISDIQSRIEELVDKDFISKNNFDIYNMANLFEFSGVITRGESASLNILAGRLVDYAYEQTGGDDTEWSNKVIGIADDIRYLSNNHDVNNKSNGWADARDEVSNTNFIPDMRKLRKESEDAIKQNDAETEKINNRIDKYNVAIDNLDENYKKTSNRKKEVEGQQ